MKYFFTGLLAVGLFVAALSAPELRGSCLKLCSDDGSNCQSGYECKSNGCGSECYQKADYKQPEGCAPLLCDIACPLGFVRDENGCDTCRCDYSALSVG